MNRTVIERDPTANGTRCWPFMADLLGRACTGGWKTGNAEITPWRSYAEWMCACPPVSALATRLCPSFAWAYMTDCYVCLPPTDAHVGTPGCLRRVRCGICTPTSGRAAY
jgi:hypothetical protein